MKPMVSDSGGGGVARRKSSSEEAGTGLDGGGGEWEDLQEFQVYYLLVGVLVDWVLTEQSGFVLCLSEDVVLFLCVYLPTSTLFLFDAKIPPKSPQKARGTGERISPKFHRARSCRVLALLWSLEPIAPVLDDAGDSSRGATWRLRGVCPLQHRIRCWSFTSSSTLTGTPLSPNPTNQHAEERPRLLKVWTAIGGIELPEPRAPPGSHWAEQAGSGSSAEGQCPRCLDKPTEDEEICGFHDVQGLRRRPSVSCQDDVSPQKQERTVLPNRRKLGGFLPTKKSFLERLSLESDLCRVSGEKREQRRLELLRHRERQAAELRGRLEDAKAEAEAGRKSLAQKDAQLAELQENIRMLMEKNNAKQEVIIKLSDQVTACMSDPCRSVSVSGGGLDSHTFRQLQQEIENLKDDIEAYKTQNKFLNSELYQLTKLWRNSSEQEKSLMVKCAYLEASNCRAESRYLGVLRQLQEIKSLDPVQREVVQKMIGDALKGELKSVLKLNVARDHDEYGFKIIPDYEVEDMKLLAKIQALEIRSHNLLHQEGVERPLLSRWAQYLAGRSHDDLCPSLELKGLLRSGIPREYRQRVWSWVVQTRTRTIREHHPQRYQQLCEKSRTSPHPASRQIQLDLHRTLTTNQNFSSPSSPALQQLRRILLAFSWQNPAIGYCQGLNRMAAIALLVLQSEEDAFWCLVAVVETIMPQDYYTKNLIASQADQRVLKDFLAEKLPRLAAHFEDHSIDVSLITFNWFLVVFVESLPSDILLPLWDAFLYEGTKVPVRVIKELSKAHFIQQILPVQ
ncbi:TBC1 domain family member 2A-like [Morone saxatilis]|uniref:TBC1 domain family member 2A-like n=1 Tax=Morone saxatilis TaxID=34816 RepID=UPI0015E24166|nr:TBC1 domain family member 2A-like [Morone saxatilis]